MNTSCCAKTGPLRWIAVADAAAFREVAHRHILAAAANAIALRGQFLLVLAGGNTPRTIYQMLRTADTDWSHWHIYFGDERCLPIDALGRNSRMAAYVWLNHVPVPADQIHTIPAESGANKAALIYAETLRHVGDFDLVLLGLGEDGHTASLFPDHDQSEGVQTADTLAIFDAPKPPAQRVSLSARRLSRTRAVLFLVEGEPKRHAITQWRKGAYIPAQAIQPKAGVDILVEAALLR